MRTYWIKILSGAFAIFVIGMIGVTLARRGIATVNSVMMSSEPITIPLGFIPFVMSGERLGHLDHLTIQRVSPREVSGVELEVDLGDSLLALGLRGCRLSADFESDSRQGGLQIRSSRRHEAFACLAGDSVPADLEAFGEAVFQPGEVRVPLFLQADLVRELRDLADDSTALAEIDADSLRDLAEVSSDSLVQEIRRSADSLARVGRRMGDSLRSAARREAQAHREAAGRMADSARAE